MATVYDRVRAIVLAKLEEVQECEVYEGADWVQLKPEPSQLDDLFDAFREEFSTTISSEEEDKLREGNIEDLVMYLEEHIGEQTGRVL